MRRRVLLTRRRVAPGLAKAMAAVLRRLPRSLRAPSLFLHDDGASVSENPAQMFLVVDDDLELRGRAFGVDDGEPDQTVFDRGKCEGSAPRLFGGDRDGDP